MNKINHLTNSKLYFVITKKSVKTTLPKFDLENILYYIPYIVTIVLFILNVIDCHVLFSFLLSLSLLNVIMSFSSTILYIVLIDFNKSSFKKHLPHKWNRSIRVWETIRCL